MTFKSVIGNEAPKCELVTNQADRVSVMVVILSLIFVTIWKLF